MKTTILNKVAMPPRLFWVPVIPACGNMAVQMACMFICMEIANINPLIFVASIVLVHVGLAVWGAKEPHLSNIAKNASKCKMPSILCDRYDSDNATVLFKNQYVACVFQLNAPISRAECLKHISKGMSVRFVSFQRNVYMIVCFKMAPKADARHIVNDIVNKLLSALPCTLLNNSGAVTPADVFKMVLSPIHDDAFSSGSSVSAQTLLIGKRTLVDKQTMCFEHNGRKVYAGVLSLSQLAEQANFDVLHQLPDNCTVLEWMKPISAQRIGVLLEQSRRTELLCTPSMTVRAQFNEAINRAQAGETFAYVGVNVYVSANSLEQLNAEKQALIQQFNQNGLTFVEEKHYLPAAFYMAMPDYDPLRVLMMPVADIG